MRLTEPRGQLSSGEGLSVVGQPLEARGEASTACLHKTSPPLPNSCEESCSLGTFGFSCPSIPPCHNGGVFQASQGSCSCPPGWMV